MLPDVDRRAVLKECLAGGALAFVGVGLRSSALGEEAQRNGDAKFREVMALPEAIEVLHSPNPVKAMKGGRSKRAYTWLYETRVRTLGRPLKIVEFGAFSAVEGKWVLANLTGKPFTTAEFAKWYECPGGRLVPGQVFSDAKNWGGGDRLENQRALWFFVGIDESGKRYRGTAMITQLGELESAPAKRK